MDTQREKDPNKHVTYDGVMPRGAVQEERSPTPVPLVPVEAEDPTGTDK